MNKENKQILSHEFNCEMLPTEPLIGIKFSNCYLVGDDNVERPLFRIELGLLFLLFSYTNVDYSDLKMK
jgi:hypothetical protein